MNWWSWHKAEENLAISEKHITTTAQKRVEKYDIITLFKTETAVVCMVRDRQEWMLRLLL